MFSINDNEVRNAEYFSNILKTIKKNIVVKKNTPRSESKKNQHFAICF